MPSTRKQKAKGRPSRQLNIMSDVENVDVMLGSYTSNEVRDDQSENELNLDSESSKPQRNSNLTGEDFRSLLTNSRENREITVETSRLINEEISNRVSRRLNEIKTSVDSQIQDAITSAITSTVLPFIQNTLEMQGRANFTMVDRGSVGPHPGPKVANSTMEYQRSSGLQRNPEAENIQKTWENRPKRSFMPESSRQMSRQSSVDSYNCEQNHDTIPKRRAGITSKCKTGKTSKTKSWAFLMLKQPGAINENL